MSQTMEYPYSVEHFHSAENISNDLRLCTVKRWNNYPGLGLHLSRTKTNLGIVVSEVEQGSPASACGLMAGDRIIEINGVQVENTMFMKILQILQDELKANKIDFLVTSSISPIGSNYNKADIVKRETPVNPSDAKNKGSAEAMTLASLVGKSTGEPWETLMDDINKNYEQMNPRPLSDDGTISTTKDLDNEFKEALSSMNKQYKGEWYKDDPDMERIMVTSKKRSYRSSPVILERQDARREMGISVAPDPDVGHIIADVVAGSPADHAHVKRGHVIIQISDEVVLHLPYKKLISLLQSAEGNRVFLSVAPKDVILRCAIEHIPILTQYDTTKMPKGYELHERIGTSNRHDTFEANQQPKFHHQQRMSRDSMGEGMGSINRMPIPSQNIPSMDRNDNIPKQRISTHYSRDYTDRDQSDIPTQRISTHYSRDHIDRDQSDIPTQRISTYYSRDHIDKDQSAETLHHQSITPSHPSAETSQHQFITPSYPMMNASQPQPITPSYPPVEIYQPQPITPSYPPARISQPQSITETYPQETKKKDSYVPMKTEPSKNTSYKQEVPPPAYFPKMDEPITETTVAPSEASDQRNLYDIKTPPLDSPDSLLVPGARRLNILKSKSTPVGFQLKTLDQEDESSPIHAFGDISPGLAADKAGVREGDRLLAVNGIRVDGMQHTQVLSLLKEDVPRLSVDVVEDEMVRTALQNSTGSREELQQIAESNLLTFTINVDSKVSSIGLRLTKDMTIQSVESNGTAEKAGLRKGDVVVSVNGSSVSSSDHQNAFHVLRKSIATGQVVLVVKRPAGSSESLIQSQIVTDNPPQIVISPSITSDKRSSIVSSASMKPRKSIQEMTRTCVLEGLSAGSPIGISLKDNKDRPSEITKITLGSPADKSGLQIRDYVLKINGKSVEKSKFSDVKTMISSSVPTGRLEMVVISDEYFEQYRGE